MTVTKSQPIIIKNMESFSIYMKILVKSTTYGTINHLQT